MGAVAFTWTMACVIVGGWRIGQAAVDTFSHLSGLYRTRDRSCRGLHKALWESARRDMKATYGADIHWKP